MNEESSCLRKFVDKNVLTLKLVIKWFLAHDRFKLVLLFSFPNKVIPMNKPYKIRLANFEIMKFTTCQAEQLYWIVCLNLHGHVSQQEPNQVNLSRKECYSCDFVCLLNTKFQNLKLFFLIHTNILFANHPYNLILLSFWNSFKILSYGNMDHQEN